MHLQKIGSHQRLLHARHLRSAISGTSLPVHTPSLAVPVPVCHPTLLPRLSLPAQRPTPHSKQKHLVLSCVHVYAKCIRAHKLERRHCGKITAQEWLGSKNSIPIHAAKTDTLPSRSSDTKGINFTPQCDLHAPHDAEHCTILVCMTQL